MKKNIVVFHLLNNYTGSPMVLRNVLEEFIISGYDVELYTSKSEGFLTGVNGVIRRNNFYFRSNFIFLTFFTFFVSQIFLIFILLFRINRKNSIIYVNTILPFSAILIGKFFRLPVIVHVHENSVSPQLLNNFLFYITNRFADQIILVSEYLKKNHQRTKAQIDVLYNSVSNEFESYPKKIKKRTDGTFNVLMLASLRPYKGINEYLELARSLSEINFELVLSETSGDISNFFSDTPIPTNLKIFPTQKNVHGFYQKADLVINLSDKNSWIETFGMTILEAMNYGLPVIVPTEGGITELVESEKNGFLIDSKDKKGLIEKIELLATEPLIWSKMSSKSFLHSSYFSKQKFNSGLHRILYKFFDN